MVNWCTFAIYAAVVTCVAGSLEARGLPRYPESLLVEIKVMKSWQSSLTLYLNTNNEDERS
jgi:hypothetical protein